MKTAKTEKETIIPRLPMGAVDFLRRAQTFKSKKKYIRRVKKHELKTLLERGE